MIPEYLARLREAAEAAGLDHDRLVAELDDHLRLGAARYEASESPEDAAALAIADLGEPETLVALVRDQNPRVSRTQRAVALVGLAAAGALWLIHTTPPAGLVNTSFETLSVIALGVLLVVPAVLMVERHPVAAAVEAIAAAGVVWAFSTSALGDHGIVVVDVTRTLVLSALVVGFISRKAGIRGALGFGVLAAGLACLIMNGSWAPYGGLAGGNGNEAITLTTIGWIWLTAAYVAPRAVRRCSDAVRSLVADGVRRAADLIGPTHPA